MPLTILSREHPVEDNAHMRLEHLLRIERLERLEGQVPQGGGHGRSDQDDRRVEDGTGAELAPLDAPFKDAPEQRPRLLHGLLVMDGGNVWKPPALGDDVLSSSGASDATRRS